jgi:hypothetical protein
MDIGTLINTITDLILFIPNLAGKTALDFLTPLVGFGIACIVAGIVWILAMTIQLSVVVLPIQNWWEKRERERALEEYNKSVTVNPDGSVMAVHTDSVEKVSPMLTAVPVEETGEGYEEEEWEKLREKYTKSLAYSYWGGNIWYGIDD